MKRLFGSKWKGKEDQARSAERPACYAGEPAAGEPAAGVPRISGTRLRGTPSDEGRGEEGVYDADVNVAFANAYRQNKHYVFNLARRPWIGDATHDIVQVVFKGLYVRLLDGLPMPRPLRPALAGMVGGALKNYYRVEARRRIDGEPDDDEIPTSKPNPEQQLCARQDASKEEVVLNAILLRMKPDARVVLVMMDYDRLSVEEAVQILGCSENALYVRLHRARETFKKLARSLYDLLHGRPKAS